VIPGEHRDLAECIRANGRAPLASEPLRSCKEVLSPPINQKESRLDGVLDEAYRGGDCARKSCRRDMPNLIIGACPLRSESDHSIIIMRSVAMCENRTHAPQNGIENV